MGQIQRLWDFNSFRWIPESRVPVGVTYRVLIDNSADPLPTLHCESYLDRGECCSHVGD
jgi:hypothetical protein